MLKTPKKHQLEGVEKINRFKGRVLLADDMGCGKTFQSLYWAVQNDTFPLVVICPCSVKWDWEDEAKCFKLNSIVVDSKTKTDDLKTDVIIINYDIIQKFADYIMKLKPRTLVLDECHYLKEKKTIRTRAVHRIGAKTEYILGLSGTPILSRPLELFSNLNLIRPDLFPSYYKYVMKYCNPKKLPWGWDVSGSKNLDNLYEILQNEMMIRRTRKEISDGKLGNIKRLICPLEIDLTLYKEVEKNHINYLRQTQGIATARRAKDAKQLTKMNLLCQIAASEKIDAYIKEAEKVINNNQKLVVMATHTAVVDKLYTYFKQKAVKVDGSVIGKKRYIAKEVFQKNDKIKMLVGNIDAAGVGLTLTAANIIDFVELDDCPAAHTQAEARIDRLTQENKTRARYFIAKGTIEEKKAKRLQAKQKIIDQILEGDDLSSFDLYDAFNNKIDMEKL